MVSLSPQVLAGRTAVTISVVGTTITYFLLDYSLERTLIYLGIYFVGLLMASYFLIQYVLNRFIYNKLSLIYRTIQNFKPKDKKSLKKVSASEDIIGEMQSEVMDYYLKNKREVDRLTVLESYRRDFIGNISHEIKTPIFNIQGYLLTLLEGGLEDPNINRKYLERAEKSVERMIKMVDELDLIIRLDTGELKLNLSTIDLIPLIREVADSNEMAAKKKNISISVKRRNMEPLWVSADEDKIAQVMTNLIVNSIKYGVEGGETIIRFHDLNERVMVDVEDNGTGIEESEIPRVFERFYRTEQGRNEDQKGVGLGLAIVKHIMEAHDQTITVNKNSGNGVTFSFTLEKAKKATS